MSVSDALKLEKLAKQYQEGNRDHTVLDDVDLRVQAGEVVALVGRSGSGKSTLLNLISGIDEPSRGRVLIKDTEVSALGEHERTLFRRRHIGFVFQFFNLIPTLTVMENLLLPLELVGDSGVEAKGRALSLLERVGLGPRGASYPDILSGGEQQRVAIARALIHRPSLLLADEPTGNLDGETGQLIIKLLAELVREAGMTVLMVTHSREVATLADRVLTMHDGKLLEAAE